MRPTVPCCLGLEALYSGGMCRGPRELYDLVTIDGKDHCEDSIGVLTGLGSIISHEIRGKAGGLKNTG